MDLFLRLSMLTCCPKWSLVMGTRMMSSCSYRGGPASSTILGLFITRSGSVRSTSQHFGSLDVTRGKILLPKEMAPYKGLLGIIVAHHNQVGRDVLVPNSNQVLDYTSNLYARSEHLFYEAFDTRRERLVHQDFRDLETGLSRFHLRTNMDFSSFKECVRFINEDVHGHRRV